jgi:putative membrane protein
MLNVRLLMVLACAGLASCGSRDRSDIDMRRTTPPPRDEPSTDMTDRSETQRTDVSGTQPPDDSGTQRTDATGTRGTDTGQTQGTDAAEAKAAAADAEALALLTAIDDHEVQAGQAAEKRKVRDAVRDYARMMQTEHGKHLEDTRGVARTAGLTLTETDKVKAQREQGAQKLRELEALPDETFERGYIDAMVEGHEEALRKIDDLLSTARKSEVVSHLRATREKVAMHLESARKLAETPPEKK